MEFEKKENKIYHKNSEGKILAEVDFLPIDDRTVVVNHTFVDKSLSGQGIAGKMMEVLAQELKSKNKKAQCTCSYAMKWFQEHEEYADVIAEQREE